MMKNCFRLFAATILLGLMATFTSCEDDEIKLSDVTITVETAALYDGVDVSSAWVVIENTQNGLKDSVQTDATGVATFMQISTGTYNVTTSVVLDEATAESYTGVYKEITLNGVESSYFVAPGMVQDLTLTLDGKAAGDLLIKQVYYNGANDPFWGVLFKDQFVEIYNNSDEVIYADGLYIAFAGPNRTGSSATDAVSTLDVSENFYATKVAQVPGSGTENPINAGESIVIALGAYDWTEGDATKATFTVDLSSVDFEFYAIDFLEADGRTGSAFFDVDNPTVPNMDIVYLPGNFVFFNMNTNGQSIAIFRSESAPSEVITDPESSESNPQYLLKISNSLLIDACDFVDHADAGVYKRFAASVDAGFNYVPGVGSTYTSKSMRRKVAKEINGRKVLKDTNNTADDFDVIDLATPYGFGE